MSVLNDSVLVLNKSWLPVNVASVREAVTLVFTGGAQFVHPTTYEPFDFDRWMSAKDFAVDAVKYLQGCDWKLIVPEVIVLRDFNGISQRTVKFSRRNIFERDGYHCQYCGKRKPRQDLNLDHVLPRSRGGRSTWENVVLACYKCNSRKDNRTPSEAGMKLLRKPQKPDWTQIKLGRLTGKMPSSWEAFLSDMYWNVELKP